MKKHLGSLITVILCSSLFTASAQLGGSGGGPAGPDFSGAMARLFGSNAAFTAAVEMQARNEKSGQDITMPGKLAYLDGKSRFELNMAQVKGGSLPPGAAEQMKQMGMDEMVTISIPERKAVYLIYPTLKAYADVPLKNSTDVKAAEFDIKTTELGRETVEGRECSKCRVVATGKDGKTQEFTVWNGLDARKFPTKIETAERGMNVVLLFKEVKFAKPQASQFELPAAYRKYDSIMALMQQEIVKRMGGGTNSSR